MADEPVLPKHIRILKLTDSADTFLSARWLDDDGNPYTITAAQLQVRLTPDDAPLLDLAVGTGITLAAQGWVNVVITAATIAAAGFEALTDTSYWELVLTRNDGVKMSALGGPVEWRRGIVA